MGFLACFSGGGARQEWGSSHSHLGQMASANARARLLDVVAAELEERCAAAGPLPPGASAATRASQDASLMRRLYQANLPATDTALGRELLRKLAALDGAREAADAAARSLAADLRSAEAAHRQAEFARARAEAIATARGEALMHAQQATREAEMQQLALADTLQQALAQLGIDVTPAKALEPLLSPALEGGAAATTPPAVRQSIFSAQQLASVAASLSKMPRQSQAWRAGELAEARASSLEAEQLRWLASAAAVPEEPEEEERENVAQNVLRRSQQQQQQQQQGAKQAHVSQERQRRSGGAASGGGGSGASLHASWQGSAGARGSQPAPEDALRQSAQALSGFTVYTNELQGEGGDDGEEVAQQAPTLSRDSRQRRSAASAPASVCGAGVRDSQGSAGVPWRSISSAALSAGSQEAEQREEAEAQQRQQQQHARQLSRLVLPTLDASQLDSLVRIGASMASPDPHVRHATEVLQQLLPPGLEAAVAEQTAQWDSAINPLQSDADARLVLQEMRAEWQRQGGSRASSRAGSRRASQEGRPGGAAVAQSMAAPTAGARPAPRIPRAGSEPPGLLQVPVFDGKVAGAGTWVSPSLAALVAHKKGPNPLAASGGAPSPPSHIKAVFGTHADREFYGPMAAHLNKQPLGRSGAGNKSSAESVRGPPRKPQGGSARSSLDGGSAEWERPQQHAAAPPPPAQQQGPKQGPALSIEQFQPMAQWVAQVAPPPRQQGQQQHALRRSSVALHDLDESAALGRPPRHAAPPHQQQRQELPATKRSLDSMRGSVGGPGADSIKASLSAVEAAMERLRTANPRLSHQHTVPQQPPQQQGRPGGDVAAQQRAARHARTRSLPEASLDDLPLHELSRGEGQRRRHEAQAAQAAARSAVYRY